MKFLPQEVPGRENGQIFGNVDTGLAEFEQFNLLFLFASAKNEAKRRFFADLLLVLGKPAEIEFHLTFVFGLEVAELEVYGDKTAQTAMVKQKVEVEVVGIDLNALLTAEEGEAIAELSRKVSISRRMASSRSRSR